MDQGGSSPLARGLLPRHAPARLRPRIIPARAGFTFHEQFREHFPGDHPRSRGVYVALAEPTRPVSGSSPLARGLPRGQQIPDRVRGIIPARAGFTTLTLLGIMNVKDHPRSRGVYLRGAVPVGDENGSSPLARGLPFLHPWEVPRVRIIPARAGFTRRGGVQCPRRRDHPRSRGVYIRMFVEADDSDGSSPLARGLRGSQVGVPLRARIIPARAGFTLCGRCLPLRAWDHPRSRGVYYGIISAPDTLSGSSPLARGLR